MNIDIDAMEAYASHMVALSQARHVPCWRVYVLVLRDGTAIKVGRSGNWTSRALRFVHPGRNLGDLFSLDRSIAVPVASKSESCALERAVLSAFRHLRVSSLWTPRRSPIPWGAGGHTEWLDAVAYDSVVRLLLESVGACRSGVVSLDRALAAWAMLQDAKLVGRIQ